MLKGKKMIPLVTHEPLYQYIFWISDGVFKTFYVSREKWSHKLKKLFWDFKGIVLI